MIDVPSEIYMANVDAWPPGLPRPSETGPERARVDDGGTWPGLAVSVEGRWVSLHSRRDPIGEADRLIADANVAGSSLLMVIGLGFGYLLDALERCGWMGQVLALEPEPSVVEAWLGRRDWRHWLTTGRLAIVIGPAYRGLDDMMASLAPNRDEPAILVNPVVERCYPGAVAAAREVVARAWFGARANQEARHKNAGRYLLNTLRNGPQVVREGDAAALDNCARSVPAIVAAAGPSLDENLADLEQYGERALVIAVDTAARPLFSAGVAPQIIVSVDPTEVNARHLAELPASNETWLVAEASVDPAAIAEFTTRTFFGRLGTHHPWPWLASLGIERGALRAWGSVVTTALDVALRLGCDPIIFAGSDLAFTRNRPYARGTTYEEDWRRHEAWGERRENIWAGGINRWDFAEETGVDGTIVRTAPHLRAFRDWIVEESNRRRDRRFVNATGAGILAGGSIEQARLADVLGRFAARPDGVVAAIREAHLADVAGAARLAGAVEELRRGGLDAATSPLSEWIGFAGRPHIDVEIRRALGLEPPRPRRVAKPATAPDRSAPPPDPLDVAARDAGVSAEQFAKVLSPDDRNAIAALVRERTPRVIVDLGSALGLAGLTALLASTADAQLYRLGDDQTMGRLASSLGLTNRIVRDHASAPPADVILLALSDATALRLDLARRAVERLAPSGVLVLVDGLAHAAGVQLHRTAYPLLEDHPNLWLLDRRFNDHTTRLAFLFSDALEQRADPARADELKRNEAHRQVAQRLAPIIWNTLHPESVRDIGCGAGYWLDALKELGARTVEGMTPIGDIAVPASRFDVCLCLDVAQRLPPDRHDALIDACTASADVVVFSSQCPGLPGGPRASRPLAYWTAKFLDRGYVLEDTLRPESERRWGFPAHVIDGFVVFRKRFAESDVPAAAAALREPLLGLARRIDDLYLQGIWWQTALNPYRSKIPGVAAMAARRAQSVPPPLPGTPFVRLALKPHRLAAGPGAARVYHLRTDAGRWFAARHGESVEILEDGEALPRLSARSETTSTTCGGWYLSRDEITIVASDGTDPRTNGRAYELSVPPHVAWAEQQRPDDIVRLGL